MKATIITSESRPRIPALEADRRRAASRLAYASWEDCLIKQLSVRLLPKLSDMSKCVEFSYTLSLRKWVALATLGSWGGGKGLN